MAKSGTEVSANAQEQAACIEETSASLEEISATTRQNADRAGEADRLMQSAHQTVERAAQAMNQLTSSMSLIAKSSHQVAGVLKTIDDIAFHTNILALNAAVEAARAGEAGAGFSVVADEVRSLAQRASHAAGETADLIGNSLSSSEQGTAISAKLSAAFAEIVTQIKEVNSGLSLITSSFQAESDGIAQIDSAVSQISNITQSQAATSEQTASAAEELRAQTVSVQRLTGELQDLVEGAGRVRRNDAG